jgi:hypothetical protein
MANPANLIFQRHSLATNFVRAMVSQRAAWAGKGFKRKGLKKPVRAKCANPRASRSGSRRRHRKAELAQPWNRIGRRHFSLTSLTGAPLCGGENLPAALNEARFCAE